MTSWQDERWKTAAPPDYEPSNAWKKLFAKFEKDLLSGKFDRMKFKGSRWADEKQENWIDFTDLDHPKKHRTTGVYRGHKAKKPNKFTPEGGYEYEIGSAFGYSSIIFVPRRPAHKSWEDTATKRIKSLMNMKSLKKTDKTVIDTLVEAGHHAEWMAKHIDTSREGT